MKIIVTHASPDMDAITSVWLLKRFLPDWHDASVEFVSAGNRTERIKKPNLEVVIEEIDGNEIIHVDTGLGPLDHHQTSDTTVCGASRTWDYVQEQNKMMRPLAPQATSKSTDVRGRSNDGKIEAIDRIVRVVVGYDHFREVFWPDSTADYHEFQVINILDGLKMQRVDEDSYYVEFISNCLDAILHNFENRIWAEKEIKENGVIMETKKGKIIGFDTINDTVVKLSQKMGYILVVRKDPRKGYVRIKTRPQDDPKAEVNLTHAYEQLKKMDPDATWFLHVSKKMLLNGSVKNPDMRPTKLSLEDIMKAIKNTI